MKKKTLFIIFGLLANLVFAQQQLPEDISESIKKRIEYGHAPSIVVGIMDKEGPQYYRRGGRYLLAQWRYGQLPGFLRICERNGQRGCGPDKLQ